MSHYDNWVRNQKRLRAARISDRNIRDLELILLNSPMTVMEGLVELGVATGYLQEEDIQAVADSLGLTMTPAGVWE
jgi:NADH:ubiquinone oxidoreductase subunit E